MIQFAAVFLVFCNSMVRGGASADSRALRLAMAATVAADFNMLITGDILRGVAIFCGVQMIYCYRYAGLRLCAALAAIWLAMLPPLRHTPPVIAAGTLYAVGSTLSLSAAILAHKKYPYPNNRLVVWGMGLFACCDVCVAVNYLAPGLAGALVWVFYLPSQVLLSFSAEPALTAPLSPRVRR